MGNAHAHLIGGRWEVDLSDQLGAGEHARTVAGRDLQMGAAVAVKLLNPDAPMSVAKRFVREARLHGKLDHYAIVPLVGAGHKRRQEYLVTPRLQGALWTQLGDTRSPKPLSLLLTRRIGQQMADALDYLHGRGEVHGDVSPGNILLDGQHRAFLADFGCSKNIVEVPRTTTSDARGTFGFMSPRVRGRRTYEDDVYSLAAVLWYCLTGEYYHRSRHGALPEPLRRPLEQALDWGSVPTAEQFRKALDEHWTTEASDWRQITSRRTRSRMPTVAVAGVAGLLIAAMAGHELRAASAHATHFTVTGSRLALRLAGNWRQSPPDALPGLALRSHISASDGSTRLTAGLTSSAGAELIGRKAIAALPIGARSPARVTVDGYPALQYGPADTTGAHASEVVALALNHDVLVLHCTGPLVTLRTTCAKGVHGLEPRGQAIQPLAPRPTIAVALRRTTRTLDGQARAESRRMRSASGPAEVAGSARRLSAAYRQFAKAVAALPATARDTPDLRAVARAANATASSYERLSTATTEPAWQDGRAHVKAQEQALETALKRLRGLGYAYSTGR